MRNLQCGLLRKAACAIALMHSCTESLNLSPHLEARRFGLGKSAPSRSILTTRHRSTSQSNEDITTMDSSSLPSLTSQREVKRLEKFSRLPVWPVWNGVFLFCVSKIFGEEVAARLEDIMGGRVCPNFWDPNQTSPFIMVVHHRHSFASWDPLRFIQRTLFPEGFPSHPHRGFVTVTYFLKGGFLHRDSMGIKQLYGAEPRHEGKHTQWLMTGAGLLHEEMFDIKPDGAGGDGFLDFLQPSSQELYQLWLNIPSQHKMDQPFTLLLGGEETPTVVTKSNEGDSTSLAAETTVLAGSHGTCSAKSPTLSDICILHVKMEPNSKWQHDLPSSHRTAIMYMRTGSATVGDKRIKPHYTCYLTPLGSQLVVETLSNQGADFLFLAGEPLDEPVSAQGSMVMNYPEEINQAYSDYQVQKMGVPWEETMSDEEWRRHVEQYPSIYK